MNCFLVCDCVWNKVWWQGQVKRRKSKRSDRRVTVMSFYFRDLPRLTFWMLSCVLWRRHASSWFDWKRLWVSTFSFIAPLKRPSENTDVRCNYPKPLAITSLCHLTVTFKYPRQSVWLSVWLWSLFRICEELCRGHILIFVCFVT